MRILLCGETADDFELPDDPEELSAKLNRELSGETLAPAKFCVFDRQHGINPGNAPVFCRGFEGSDAVAIMTPYTGGDWLATVRSMPTRLQSLLPRLTHSAAIAVPTERLLGVLPFAGTPDPIEDALIRLRPGHAGGQFEISDVILATDDTTHSLPKLAPGMSPGASPQMQEHLSRFVPEELGPVSSAADAVALTAGLFLMHDCLDRSHSLSQDCQGQGRHAASDYWHAIMHRREPDYGNSKYWYRQVGRHPIAGELAQRAIAEFSAVGGVESAAWSQRVCGGGEWNAFAWVDLCEAAGDQGGQSVVPCRTTDPVA